MQEIKNQLKQALDKYYECAALEPYDIFVVGCSTSEVLGDKIGTNGSQQCAQAIFEAVNDFCTEHKLFLAAQCCEHLNRAVVIEKAAYDHYRMDCRVNAVPMPHAGGSFGTAVYRNMQNPVVVEHICAHGGIDIGDTFIGMHLRHVAVPVRVGIFEIGKAHLTLARTRCKYIGGERANYNPSLN